MGQRWVAVVIGTMAAVGLSALPALGQVDVRLVPVDGSCAVPGASVHVVTRATNQTGGTVMFAIDSTNDAGFKNQAASCMATSGICTVNTDTNVTWADNALPGGTTAEIQYTTMILPDVPPETELCNTTLYSINGGPQESVSTCLTVLTPASCVQAAPVSGMWGMAILAAGLATAGAVVLRRRSAAGR